MNNIIKELFEKYQTKHADSNNSPNKSILLQNDPVSAEELDNQTFALIDSAIIDKSKKREFACIFVTKTKTDAKILRDCLRYNHGYKTAKPIQEDSEWLLHANKSITRPELENELAKVRKVAINHSIELLDWRLEVDSISTSNYPKSAPGTNQ